jgi:O-antigen ligase
LARLFIILVFLLLGAVDSLTRVDTGTRFSAQALLTIAYAVGCWGLLLGAGRISKTALKAIWPFIALVTWALTTMFWYTPSVDGMQNVLCLVTFAGMALLTAGLAEGPGIQKSIEAFLPWGVWCAAAVYGYSMFMDGLGTSDLVGPRSFGIAALFGIAWYASKWRFGGRGALLLTLVLLLETGASLSRLALVAGLVLLTLGRVSASVKGWVWGLLSLALAIGGFWWMFNTFEPLREHFLTGDVRLRLGDAAINVSGRAQYWRTTFDSFLESPWLGHGAGSAMQLMRDHFHVMKHPHNDYLRVMHDYGAVGLGLWMLAWGKLVWRTWAQARFSEKWRRPDAHLQFAAFLVTLAMCMMMVTDNPMTYIFAMAPLGALVGAASGTAAAQARERQPLRLAVPAAMWSKGVAET